MSSTETSPQSGAPSDLDLAVCTTTAFSAILFVGCALVSGIFFGAFGLRVIAYTMAGVGTCVGVIYWIVRIKKWRRFAIVVAVLIAAEALLATKFMLQDHRHHVVTAQDNGFIRTQAREWLLRWEFHPIYGIVPKPGYSNGAVSHTAEGLRTTIGTPREGAPTVILVGGSTTYDFNSDEQTWASRLEADTGLNVINLGVITYTSVDHVIQTALQVPEYQPRCAVYYLGWNDMREVGIVHPRTDYSDYHERMKYQELDIPDAFDLAPFSPLENSALAHQLINSTRETMTQVLSRLNQQFFAPRAEGGLTSEADPTLLAAYQRNLQSIVALNGARGIRTVFVPQVMNPFWRATRESPGWTLFIRPEARLAVMADYNRTVQRMAAPGRNVWVVDSPLRLDWRAEDFVDEGHFSPAGSERFATAIAPEITRICGR